MAAVRNIWEHKNFEYNGREIPKKVNRKNNSDSKKRYQTTEAFASVGDIKKVLNHFIDKKEFLNYFLSTIQCTMGWRSGDLLQRIKWVHFINPDGTFKKYVEIIEEKTGKVRKVYISNAVKEAIIYYRKMIDYDLKSNSYMHVNNPAKEYISYQFGGGYAGRRLSQSGFRGALQRACEIAGVAAHIGTHGLRKTFATYSFQLDSKNPLILENLRVALNHADQKTTAIYTGSIQENVDRVYEKYSDFWSTYVVGNEQIVDGSSTNNVMLDYNSFMDAFESFLSKVTIEDSAHNAKVTTASIDFVKDIQDLIMK